MAKVAIVGAGQAVVITDRDAGELHRHDHTFVSAQSETARLAGADGPVFRRLAGGGGARLLKHVVEFVKPVASGRSECARIREGVGPLVDQRLHVLLEELLCLLFRLPDVQDPEHAGLVVEARRVNDQPVEGTGTNLLGYEVVVLGRPVRDRELLQADVLDAYLGGVGVLRADGGATANGFLMQFQADLLGSPVGVAPNSETTALGAALARMAVGTWPDLDALRRRIRSGAGYEPAMSRDEAESRQDARRRALRLAFSRA